MGNKIDRKMNTEEADRLLGEQFLKEAEEARQEFSRQRAGTRGKTKKKNPRKKRKQDMSV
ncbi:hypothetical protein DW049_12455 [Ruminococcus sp. AF41-9]|nr:hypothetical protein DW049_12455 [Ruminococcus sp. AF41-9]